MQPVDRFLQPPLWRAGPRGLHTWFMFWKQSILPVALAAALMISGLGAGEKPPSTAPQYTADGHMRLPDNYREWVYLTSGFDMSYTPDAQADHHMFDNVFVNPEAYRSFLATGTWPDKTVMVLETRGAEGRRSINRNGNYQSTAVMGVEVHVKDTQRFPEGWAFFGFGSEKPAAMIPRTASCYSCHLQHAAVDTTFVQFYPVLLPIAKSKGTLSGSYLKETAEEKR